jgi:hypothetical protein
MKGRFLEKWANLRCLSDAIQKKKKENPNKPVKMMVPLLCDDPT